MKARFYRSAMGILMLCCCVMFPVGAQEANFDQSPADPAWHGCNRAEECTIIRGFCGYPESVNALHRDAYEAWIKNGPPAHCALLAPVSKMCVTCEKQRCTIKTERNPEANADALKQLINKLNDPAATPTENPSEEKDPF